MDHIEKVTASLMKAIEDVYEVTGAFTIDAFDSDVKAQLQPEEFEKTLEGRDVRLVKRSDSEFPYQREVTIGGVNFFCLLSAREARLLVEAGV